MNESSQLTVIAIFGPRKRASAEDEDLKLIDSTKIRSSSRL